ncbi:MAG: hypothetical protein J6D30_01615 [Clostridia bacterium]|nr:hypothetical protein [Clostridia bacterium]
MAMEQDVKHLQDLYEGRKAYHGEMHDHAATGGTSDGKKPLSHWKGAMEALQIDFAAILDHRQVRHMYLPEWEDGLFICGSEPGTHISDSKAEVNGIHYNLIVPNPHALEDLLNEFTEYEFTGPKEGSEGHFKYPWFTIERLRELIASLKAKGGFFVHPHPSHVMQSNDSLDYWFADETGFEVFYYSMDSEYVRRNYKIWTDILAAGKRIWAIAGGDGHACCSDGALTTIYAKELSSPGLLDYLRIGDFVCGPVGIRMCIGDTTMGGKCAFDGGRLVVSVGDFHKSVIAIDHKYRMDIITDQGVIHSEEVATCKEHHKVVFLKGIQQGPESISTEESYFAMDVDVSAKFYRVEVFDETRNLRIAIGNPIWNTKYLED